MTPQGSRAQRYHGLDLLRAVAMLLGLAIHAPLVYFIPEMQDGFRLADVPEPQIWVQIMVGWIHQWRMPAFFLLAGFFAVLVLERRGSGAYSRDRLVRIGLAFLIFVVPYDLLDGRLNGDLMHLWFLYYLMPICLIAAGLWKLGVPLRWAAFPARRLWTWPIYLVLLVPVGVWAYGVDLEQDIPERLGEFRAGSFLYFLIWFGLGAALYVHRAVLERLSSWPVIAATFVLGSVMMIAGWEGAGPVGPVATMGLVLSAIGLAHRSLTKSNKGVGWLIELSYPVYLLHLLPAVFLGAWFVHLGLPQIVAIPLNIALSFAISVLLYYALIKFTPLNWVVNGYKKSWFKLPARRVAA